MLICDKCGGKVNEGFKFCPLCGDPITEADTPSKEVSTSNIAQVEISFGYSTSRGYERAVDIVKNIPTYKEDGTGKDIVHKVSLPITEVELLINIYDIVGSWKSSRMLINGQPQTKSALVYYGVGCYRERLKAFKPEQYCFGQKEYEYNIWGCKRLNMPITSWGGGWLDYGQFDQNGVWHFDKKRIRHDLEINISENELCPVLNPFSIFETLEKLPNTIDPKTDKNWQYITSYEEVNGEYQKVAKGIKPILNKANVYVIGRYRPLWESDEPSDNDVSQTITVDLTATKPKQENVSQTTKAGTSGCLVMMILIIAACVYAIL